MRMESLKFQEIKSLSFHKENHLLCRILFCREDLVFYQVLKICSVIFSKHVRRFKMKKSFGMILAAAVGSLVMSNAMADASNSTSSASATPQRKVYGRKWL